MTRVLVIDDDRSIRHTVKTVLEGCEGIEVLAVEDGQAGLAAITDFEPSVCLLDVYLPEHHGLELFHQIHSLDCRLPVIFITGDTSSQTAIEAMKAGAYDYLAKPLNVEQLKSLTLSAANTRRRMDEPVAIQVDDQPASGEQFIGHCPAMLDVFKDIGRVAAQNVAVLIRGESGAGKELVARALVQHSDRQEKSFVAVNCAAIPDQLLESELFGHEKGAYTGAEKKRIGRFEQCDGGTIFLDEVGDMSPIVQGKVLRLLQEQKFERIGGNEVIETDVRIVAATNRPLEDMVESGDFREDLLYRLNSFTIQLPPLRERQADLPALVEYFLGRAKTEMDKPELTGISQPALDLLTAYQWPGNVRQLQSVVRQALLASTGTVVTEECLPDFVRSPSASSDSGEPNWTQYDAQAVSPSVEPAPPTNPPEDSASTNDSSRDKSPPIASANAEFRIMDLIEERLDAGSTNLYTEVVEELERRLFARVLEVTDGNQSKAAEILGITRGKVRDRISAYSIQVDKRVSYED